MKAILLAASLLVACTGVALAESDGDAFGQHLNGAGGRYVVGAAVLPPAETPSMGIVQSSNSLPRGFNGPASVATKPVAGVGQPVPGYAQLLPDQSGMGVVQTPNSLPRAAAARTAGHGG